MSIKTHSLIQERNTWQRILVLGDYDRTCAISKIEKGDKLFNWQRPTAVPRGDTLILKCFPGQEYVLHYALIIATYLYLAGRADVEVCYTVPSNRQCNRAIASLARLDPHPIVVTGFGLEKLAGADGWTDAGSYAWKEQHIGEREATFLGFYHSMWGDVAGRVVRTLASQGARAVVYVGKVGTLRPKQQPNAALATGNVTRFRGETVSWQDYFAGLQGSNILRGKHVHSPSILLENQEWVRRHKGYDFVDPEIAHMATSAMQKNVGFGYLHIISNNLREKQQENLSNEREPQIVQKRKSLLRTIERILFTWRSQCET